MVVFKATVYRDCIFTMLFWDPPCCIPRAEFLPIVEGNVLLLSIGIVLLGGTVESIDLKAAENVIDIVHFNCKALTEFSC